jgi:hypothetical protein
MVNNYNKVKGRWVPFKQAESMVLWHRACSTNVKAERCRSKRAKMNKAGATMKHLEKSQREVAQINTLISNLSQSVELLNFDIVEIEELFGPRPFPIRPIRSSRVTSGPDEKTSWKLSRRFKPAWKA